MGIEAIKQPSGSVDAGIFNLPPNFPTKKFAVEWVEEGQVPFKKQRQSLPGANASADGWEVYKGTDGKDKLTTTTNGAGKKFVLMVRPRKLQDDVNALFGNVSKKHILSELKGETVAGAQPQDAGMLPQTRLQREQTSSAEQGDIALNPLSVDDEQPSAAMST